MSEELRAENSGFSRLLELLHGGYLRRGVRSSVAGRLEQVEARLLAAKRSYLERSLLHSELEPLLTVCGGRSDGQRRTIPSGVGVVGAAEAQHCLRLHPEVSLLGLSAQQLRNFADTVQPAVSKSSILQQLEERLKQKCLRVANWYSEGRTGSEGLQLAKANQLPQLLAQKLHHLDSLEEELQLKRRENSEKLLKQYIVLVETSTLLLQVLEQYKLGVMAEADRINLAHLQARCHALLGKQDVMYHQLVKGICSEGRLQALQEIRLLLDARLQQIEEQLVHTQHILQQYQGLGSQLTGLAQQYRAILAEIENKQWALTELGKSIQTSH